MDGPVPRVLGVPGCGMSALSTSRQGAYMTIPLTDTPPVALPTRLRGKAFYPVWDSNPWASCRASATRTPCHLMSGFLQRQRTGWPAPTVRELAVPINLHYHSPLAILELAIELLAIFSDGSEVFAGLTLARC